MEERSLCRHVLTWIIRSIADNELYVDTFWLRHLCRHGAMSSMSTRFDLVYKVDSGQWALCRHVLTWIIRSIADNELCVDTFWLRHLCRHEKFRELNILISKLGTCIIKSTLFREHIKVDISMIDNFTCLELIYLRLSMDR